jgi:spectinomycin phosphotransferase
MRESPATLSTDRLRACLADRYGIGVTGIHFLPLGHDAAAWVYRVDAQRGGPYFLKACLRIRNEAGLVVPRYLHEHGLTNVVAPLPTRDGRLWTETDGFALVLYRFVEGQTGMQRRLTPDQWRAYGSVLGRLHTLEITPALAHIVQRDPLTPPGAGLVGRLDAQLREPPDDEAQRQLATFWPAKRDLIQLLLGRAEALGQRLAEADPPFVLCHADIHTNNVLVGTDGRIWFVDWDEVALAPPERDLMFAVDGISRAFVTPAETEYVLQGYGPAPLDPLALAYYRYAWAISDVSAYGESICLRPDLSLTTRLEEAAVFEMLFAPGHIVEIALDSPMPT